MKKPTLLLTLAVSLSAGFALHAFAADEKKEPSVIGKAMKEHFKGDTSNIKKAAKGELTKEQVTTLLAAAKTVAAAKPAKGDEASWKAKNGALVTALEKLEKGEAGAGDAVKAAANCKACHDVHKGK